MTKTRAIICPYCGDTQPTGERCRSCGGMFEPLSRQATHNEMGPWYIRSELRPFQPGCSYETLVKLVERGQIDKHTIIRGPTTKQFWTIAKRVPGVAHLLGYCHNCDTAVNVGDHGCHVCGVPFGAYLDRNYLGLPDIKPLPWEASSTDEEPAAGRLPRLGMDLRGAPQPLGISSFASDAELRSSGLSPLISAPHLALAEAMDPAPSPALDAASTPAETNGEGQGAAGTDITTLLTVRAAEERVRRMQRTIQLLAGGLIGLAIVVVILLLSRPASPASPPAAPASQTPSRTGDPAPPPQIDVEAELARAEHLIAGERTEGGDNEAPTTEQRIAALEEALRILRRIDAQASPDQKPPDLRERIQALQREIDDLKTAHFFP